MEHWPTSGTAPFNRDYELFITREFAAPVELIWQSWERRDHLRRWWRSVRGDIPVFEFRQGGAWRGGFGSGKHHLHGKIRSIAPQERIVSSFASTDGAIETVVTLTFFETNDLTVVHLHQTPFATLADRDRHVSGWNLLFDAQQRYAEALAELAR